MLLLLYQERKGSRSPMNWSICLLFSVLLPDFDVLGRNVCMWCPYVLIAEAIDGQFFFFFFSRDFQLPAQLVQVFYTLQQLSG